MSEHGYRGKRRYKKRIASMQSCMDDRGPGLKEFLQIAGIGIILILIAVFIGFSIVKGQDGDPERTEIIETESEQDTEEVMIDQIQVDDVVLTGLTKEEAKEKLLNTYTWNLQLSYENETKDLVSPFPNIFDRLLDEVYFGDRIRGERIYTIDYSQVEEDINVQVKKAADKWNKKAEKAQLTGRDKEKNRWIYSEGKGGVEINQEKAVGDIMELIKEKRFEGVIPVESSASSAEFTSSQIREKYKVIGAFSTTATDNENRNNNIVLAMNALDGLVIFPGEEFSFNRTTGNRTIERGYKPAGAYRNGEFVEEPGGGVCQVSSTLYNAIIFSGISTTERNPHSFEPSYVIPGEDSMVSYDGYSGPDLRFVNKQDTSVAIRAVFEDKKLTISMIGIPILEEGVQVSMRSEKIKEYDPPEPNYQEDQTLQPGVEKVVKEPVRGTTWKTYLVTSKEGKVVEEHYFHTSTYRGKPGEVKRNTSGIVIPAEPATADVEKPVSQERPIQQETSVQQETTVHQETSSPVKETEKVPPKETSGIGPGFQ